MCLRGAGLIGLWGDLKDERGPNQAIIGIWVESGLG